MVARIAQTVITKLPAPIEFIFNTPSHHRVHHGRNRYCIDKNYGGTLIIWDRLFGTFAAESDPVVYGLTHPINTFNPWTIQSHHYRHICRLIWALPSLGDKVKAIVFGPGWAPGKPRLGLLHDIPEVSAPWPKFDPWLPRTWQAYFFMDSLITLISASTLLLLSRHLDRQFTYAAIAYFCVSIWCDHLCTI